MASDLVEFLRARLAHDEQIARAALRADVCCWEHERLGGYDRLIEMYTYPDRSEDSDVIALFGADGLAEHIALHDPKRVLAEVDAKRRVVDEGDTSYDGADEYRRVLALLALPYASHPDYREEWRP